VPKRTSSYRAHLLERLTAPEEAASYLNAALEDSPEMFLTAVRDVAQAHQMAKVAKAAGVQRESLYRAFSTAGNPTLDTLFSVLSVLKIKPHFEAESETKHSRKASQSRARYRRRRAVLRSDQLKTSGQLKFPFAVVPTSAGSPFQRRNWFLYTSELSPVISLEKYGSHLNQESSGFSELFIPSAAANVPQRVSFSKVQ